MSLSRNIKLKIIINYKINEISRYRFFFKIYFLYENIKALI